MYNIEFYETIDGISELWEFLDDLQQKALTNKDARIQHTQISLYIQLLADHGTRLGEKIMKHLEEDIWELRPGHNRVLFFIIKTILMYCCIILERKRRRHHEEKSIKQKLSEMTG